MAADRPFICLPPSLISSILLLHMRRSRPIISSTHRETKRENIRFKRCLFLFLLLPPPSLCKATHSIISEHVLVVVHYSYAGATAAPSHGRIRNFHNYMQHAICKSPQNAASAHTLEYVRDDIAASCYHLISLYIHLF